MELFSYEFTSDWGYLVFILILSITTGVVVISLLKSKHLKQIVDIVTKKIAQDRVSTESLENIMEAMQIKYDLLESKYKKVLQLEEENAKKYDDLLRKHTELVKQFTIHKEQGNAKETS